MNRVERAFRRADLRQRRLPPLALAFAVVKKFGDDQAGGLAALIAYYGFFSMFPLLLLFVSVLGIILPGDPGIQHQIVHSALAQFPVIGTEIGSKAGVHGLTGTWLTAAVGAAGAVWAGLGVRKRPSGR
jgi:membrane protein